MEVTVKKVEITLPEVDMALLKEQIGRAHV